MLRCTKSLLLRRIVIERDTTKNVVKISGQLVQPQFKRQALPKISENDEDTCPLRARGIEVSKNDVLILRQFMRSDGSILAFDDTKLAERSYKKVVAAIKMAQREGLLPSYEPEYCVHGAPLPKYSRYNEARYPIGSRVDQYHLNNRQTREESAFMGIGYKKGNDAMEMDAPRVNRLFPRKMEIRPFNRETLHDPRVKNDY